MRIRCIALHNYVIMLHNSYILHRKFWVAKKFPRTSLTLKSIQDHDNIHQKMNVQLIHKTNTHCYEHS